MKNKSQPDEGAVFLLNCAVPFHRAPFIEFLESSAMKKGAYFSAWSHVVSLLYAQFRYRIYGMRLLCGNLRRLRKYLYRHSVGLDRIYTVLIWSSSTMLIWSVTGWISAHPSIQKGGVRRSAARRVVSARTVKPGVCAGRTEPRSQVNRRISVQPGCAQRKGKRVNELANERTHNGSIMRRFPGGGSQRKPTEERGWLSLCAAIRRRFPACLAE